jgi:chromosome condensin MukBEF ATPase and DNA-binding subunit MukB
MSNEEFQKKMDFIVEQQAQFSVDMQKLREAHAQTELVIGQLANLTFAGFNEVNAKINTLVDSQIRTDEKINALTDNVQNLTAIVDRYFTEGRNGN